MLLKFTILISILSMTTQSHSLEAVEAPESSKTCPDYSSPLSDNIQSMQIFSKSTRFKARWDSRQVVFHSYKRANNPSFLHLLHLWHLWLQQFYDRTWSSAVWYEYTSNLICRGSPPRSPSISKVIWAQTQAPLATSFLIENAEIHGHNIAPLVPNMIFKVDRDEAGEVTRVYTYLRLRR